MMRGFRGVGTILMLPPGTPKDIVATMKTAVEKTHADRHFKRNTKSSRAVMNLPRWRRTIRRR
jgi:hypothetical protein